jgi:hypothetical protein
MAKIVIRDPPRIPPVATLAVGPELPLYIGAYAHQIALPDRSQPADSAKALSATLRRTSVVQALAGMPAVRRCAEHRKTRHVTWRNIVPEVLDLARKIRLEMMVSSKRCLVLRFRFSMLIAYAGSFDVIGTSCGNNGLACASGQCTSKDRRSSFRVTLLWNVNDLPVQCQTVGSSMNLTRGCSQKGDTSCVVSCQTPGSA